MTESHINKRSMCVVTTVNHVTPAIKALSTLFEDKNLIVIGDTRTPENWKYKGVAMYFAEDQCKMPFSLVKALPLNHYVRKNIGYLVAIKAGAQVIYDTDDDNIPNENWKIRTKRVKAQKVTKKGWCNVYKLFNQKHIWPRGLALESLQEPTSNTSSAVALTSLIQQGVSNESPDVDAVWRLTANKPIYFSVNRHIALGPRVWCPFNSQSTWWWPEVYPLLYLPVTATFRMTDIWRSFIAQRCLWELQSCVTFHSPAEVVQKRNKHNLLNDFKDEVPGYLKNSEIVKTLEKVTLLKGKDNVSSNMLTCYRALVSAGLLTESELLFLNAWLYDIKSINV